MPIFWMCNRAISRMKRNSINTAMKLIFLLCIFALFACSSENKKTVEPKSKLAYSPWLSITESEKGVLISITNPDKITEKFDYFIGENGPANATNISVSQNGLAVLSSTHVGMLGLLNEINAISAVADKKYIYNKELKNRINNGKVVSLGQETDFSVDMLLNSNSKLVVYSAFSGKLAIDNKLKKLGIITIPNFDWRETHPLGKAQWLLLFGYLTGKQDLAKKEFAAIVKRYNEVKSQSKKSNVKTLVGNLAGDFWYAPAGGSYNATLLNDAGVNYIFKDSEGTGSLSLTLESVFSKLDAVSLWLNPGFMSKELIVASNPKAAYFPVYSKGEIYCYAYDMNRFWELSAVQPDLVLSDLQQIIDKFNSNKKLHFYKRVE